MDCEFCQRVNKVLWISHWLITHSMTVWTIRRFGGFQIPKGTPVGISPIHTHHMPSIWTDPHRFDPERFSPARAEHKQHPSAYLPFGGGAHLCIGQHFADMEVKSVLHQVLRQFRFSVPAGYRMPYQLVPIAKPKDGLPITLQRL